MKKVQALCNTQINPKLGEEDKIESLINKAAIELLEEYVKGLKFGYHELRIDHSIGFEVETVNYDSRIVLVEYEK